MKMNDVVMVKPVKIDLNAGFLESVPQEINESLLNLQKSGYVIRRVSQPLIDGRFCYFTIEYIIPELDLGDE